MGALTSWAQQGSNLSIGYGQSVNVNPVSANDGVNAVYFASASGEQIGFQVIAVTEVTYYVASGEIAGADMIFNDGDYHFTDHPGDTGQMDPGSGLMKVYLGDVATHEIGHAWGLDHSTVLRSTLIYSAFSGQYNLGRDDRTAVRTMYPAAGSVAASGSISGSIVGQRGGIFGAHVEAINLATGNVEAGTLSSADGSFRIGDLPPGNYSVLVEPYLVGTGTISYYYGNVDHRFCPNGAKFKRTFYSACGADGAASVVRVSAGAAAAIGTVAPSCSAVSNAGAEPSTLGSARSLPATGGAAFGKMSASGTHYWKITMAGGSLTAKALSYTLYSPLDTVVHILDANGNPVAAATELDNVETPMPGGYTNFDASATHANLPAGTYYLQVDSHAGLLPSSNYPAGSQLLDGSGFYLLSVAVAGGFAASGTTSMNACVSVPNIPQSPITSAPNTQPVQAPDPKSLLNVGACATVEDMGRGGNSGGAMGAPGTANLLLILVAAMLAQAFVRLRAQQARIRR